MVMLGIAALTPVHDPAEQDGEQHERDESADQRPVHGVKDIRAWPDAEPARSEPAFAERLGLTLSVASHLLAGRRECPGDLHAPFLTEDETQLAGRPEPIRVRRAEGCARSAGLDRAEKILMKKAVLAARFRGRGATIRHA